MAGWKKRLRRMEENPKGWRYKQLASILKRFGFEENTRAGSHVTWKHPHGHRVTIVDKGSGTLKPAAVEEAIAVLSSMEVDA